MRQSPRVTTISLILITVLFVGLRVANAAGEKLSWSGWITDDECDPAKVNVASPAHQECVKKCLEKHRSLVLYTDDKRVFKLNNQVLAKEHIGHAVAISGRLSGDMIIVDSIAKKTSG